MWRGQINTSNFGKEPQCSPHHPLNLARGSSNTYMTYEWRTTKYYLKLTINTKHQDDILEKLTVHKQWNSTYITASYIGNPGYKWSNNKKETRNIPNWVKTLFFWKHKIFQGKTTVTERKEKCYKSWFFFVDPRWSWRFLNYCKLKLLHVYVDPILCGCTVQKAIQKIILMK